MIWFCHLSSSIDWRSALSFPCSSHLRGAHPLNAWRTAAFAISSCWRHFDWNLLNSCVHVDAFYAPFHDFYLSSWCLFVCRYTAIVLFKDFGVMDPVIWSLFSVWIYIRRLWLDSEFVGTWCTPSKEQGLLLCRPCHRTNYVKILSRDWYLLISIFSQANKSNDLYPTARRLVCSARSSLGRDAVRMLTDYQHTKRKTRKKKWNEM